MMNKYIEKILNKLFGKVEYVVTIVDSSGSVKRSNGLSTIKEVDELIADVNSDRYMNVQKIEKIRRYDFKHDKEILHSPLFFVAENVTEAEYVDDQEYSFLKKHESLTNIKRVSSPEMINTGGDGVNEPSYYELYCMKKKLFIEPQPVECQVKECDSYDLKS